MSGPEFSFSSVSTFDPAPALRCGGGAVDELLEERLLAPVREFLQRPSKRFRATLVSLGARLATNSSSASVDPQLLSKAAALLEQIHAGSLVVDDIEDDSLARRGAPTLHRLIGLGPALNAGNWLYYAPLESVARWELGAESERQVYRACHRALLCAHYGQAIDLGAPIDCLPQAQVERVCLASLEWKSGGLTALALRLGALLAGCNSERSDALELFGTRFGVALQMFDDLGNLEESKISGVADGKQYEDLRLRRPSWLWAVASRRSEASYAQFLTAVRALPDVAPIDQLLAASDLVAAARTGACDMIHDSVARLGEAVGESHATFIEVREIAQRLTRSYGAR